MLKTPADPVDIGLRSAQGSQFVCHYTLAQLPRFTAGLAGAKGQVDASFSFRKVQGFPALEGSMAAQVTVICQRCLEIFLLPLVAELKLVFVPTEEDESLVPAELEAVVHPDHRLGLRELVEDELLLSFPLVPMHALGDPACRPAVKVLSEAEATVTEVPAAAVEVTTRPLAGLKDLLRRED